MELKKVEEWFRANKMQLNSKKTRFVIFNLSRAKRGEVFDIELDGEKLIRVSELGDEKFVRLVGVLLDEELSFKYHVAQVKAKLSRINFVIAKSRNLLPPNIRLLIYNSLVKSVLEFTCVIYGTARIGVIGVLEKIKKKIIRNDKGARSLAHTNDIFLELGILKFRDMVEYGARIMGFGVYHKKLPENIRSDFELVATIGRETRAMVSCNLKVPFCGKRWLEAAPCMTVPIAWNSLSVDLKMHGRLGVFKNNLRKDYFEKYKNEPKCKRNGCYSCTRH